MTVRPGRPPMTRAGIWRMKSSCGENTDQRGAPSRMWILSCESIRRVNIPRGENSPGPSPDLPKEERYLPCASHTLMTLSHPRAFAEMIAAVRIDHHDAAGVRPRPVGHGLEPDSRLAHLDSTRWRLVADHSHAPGLEGERRFPGARRALAHRGANGTRLHERCSANQRQQHPAQGGTSPSRSRMYCSSAARTDAITSWGGSRKSIYPTPSEGRNSRLPFRSQTLTPTVRQQSARSSVL